ncbi:MAG: PAS domain-containing protein [Rhodothalassiaceae bacterium]
MSRPERPFNGVESVSTGQKDIPEIVFGPSFASVPDAAAVAAFRAELGAATLAAVFDLWLNLGASGPAARTAVSPRVFKAHLPRLAVLEFLAHQRDLKFRLVGTEIDDWVGVSMTGKRVREVFRRSQDVFDLFWAPVCDAARPRLDLGSLQPFEKAFIQYRAVHLPLLDEQGHVRFTLMAFERRERARD